MIGSRRGFLKKLVKASAVATVGTTTAVLANSEHKSRTSADSNGVVVGKSKKKEIIYKKTATWTEYYNSAK